MENISVYVRIKPKTSKEENSKELWKNDANSLLSLKASKEIFTFSK